MAVFIEANTLIWNFKSNVKEFVHPKNKNSHQLLSLMSFQTHKKVYFQNTNEDIFYET